MNGDSNILNEGAKVKCKKCGHELPVDAVFCDSCGAPVKKTVNRDAGTGGKKADTGLWKGLLVTGAALLLVVVVLAIGISNSSGKNDSSGYTEREIREHNFSEMSSRVTPEQYNQLEFTMTIEEVTELLGEEGTEYHSNRYIWPGEYYSSEQDFYKCPMLKLTFSDNGNLIEIEERNILDGREVYEAPTMKEMPRLTLSEDVLSSMKNRMSYREIADILGEEGALRESTSKRNIYSSKTYEWKYVMEDEKNPFDKILDIEFNNDKARQDAWSIWGKE